MGAGVMAKIDEIFVEIKPFTERESAEVCARIVELYAKQTDTLLVIVEDSDGWQRIRFLEDEDDS